MRNHILPFFISVLCLILLLGGAGLLFAMNQYAAPANTAYILPQEQALSVVLLDDVWADALCTNASTDAETLQAEIDKTLSGVGRVGGNAIALTGRLGEGDALFRDKSESVPIARDIAKTDTFFEQLDPFAMLIASAHANGMEVLLLPTGVDNALLHTETLAVPAALPAFVRGLVEDYGIRLLTQSTTSANADGLLSYQVTTIQNAQVTESAPLYYVTAHPEVHALSFVQQNEITHVLLGNYLDLMASESSAMQLFTAYYANGVALPDLTGYLGSDYVRTLSVTYPKTNGSVVNDSNLFLMGTSNPDEPLTMNGEPVERYGTQGVWGVLLSLTSGENTVDFVNGSDTVTYTVEYDRWAGSGDDGSGDGSSSGVANYYDLPEGQTIRITDAIASALSSVYDASSITQTFYQGAVMEVTRYLSYKGKTEAYAYQLTTGDWVRAACAELHDTNRMHVREGGSSFNTETRASILLLTDGTPAVYHVWEGNTLTLTLLTTHYAGAAPSSDWFTSTVSTDGDNTIFTFTFTDAMPLYGWAVNYDTAANATTISLKQPPTLSTDPTLPLTGVRVLLDAGHGVDDFGAMGAGGIDAPVEKEVNLALTMATKYRLEQLGATVLLTREDDSFPTLGDRVTALNTLHPDFFISVHHNSLELTRDINQSSGVEAYWFYDQGDPLATALIGAVSNAAERNLRSSNYGYYYVTRSNICPATLLEVGFMTNPAEYEDLVNVDTIWAEAGAIAQTIYNTLANQTT